MKLIINENPHKIVADKGKHIRDVNDVYVPEHYDEETHELIPEHFPYYSEIIYVPNSITEEMMYEMYVEEEMIKDE